MDAISIYIDVQICMFSYILQLICLSTYFFEYKCNIYKKLYIYIYIYIQYISKYFLQLKLLTNRLGNVDVLQAMLLLLISGSLGNARLFSSFNTFI
jgi:hypothetical protein